MIKGALVELMPAFGVSMPNVVAFQFNPETLRHAWSQPPAATAGSDPLAAQGLPGETFSLTLAMDATDQLARGETDPQGADARRNGISSRLAALEMLMFPLDADSGLTAVAAPTGGRRSVPAAQLRTVLFVWGEGRIVPVRVTSLVVTEKLFDAALNPTHAEAQIELRVLTRDDCEAIAGPLKVVASGAYAYSQKRREVQALFNLTTAAGSIELPRFPGI